MNYFVSKCNDFTLLVKRNADVKGCFYFLDSHLLDKSYYSCPNLTPPWANGKYGLIRGIAFLEG